MAALRNASDFKLGNIVPGAFTPVLTKHTKNLSLVDILAWLGVVPQQVINRREDFRRFAERCVLQSLPAIARLVHALWPS